MSKCHVVPLTGSDLMLYVRANFNRVKSHVMLYVKESVLWSFEKKKLDLGDNCCIRC